jgi:PEGA domain
MSPEQMYGQSVDARSDIYCLGILIYELLTLRRLFPVWDVNEMRAVFEAGPIPLPSTIAKHVGREVDPVIMKALSQDVNERYQNGNEFEEDLRKLIARSGTAVTSGGLSREINALDEAPGPRAPRTAPPVVSSSQSSVTGSPKPQTATGAPHSGVSPAQSLGTHGGQRPVTGAPRTAESLTARKTPIGDQGDAPDPRAAPRTGTQASPQSHAAPMGTQPMGAQPMSAQPPNTRTTQAAGVQTQPMPLQRDLAPAKIDVEHSFVISLAEGGPVPQALAPLPSTSAQAVSQDKSRTHVLAQNDALAWTNEIGQDAEWLALMRATGAAPGAGRRTVLIAAGLGIAVLIAAAVVAGPDLAQMAKRAVAGKKQALGVIIVKTIPSGAEVSVDGKARGKTNLKLTGIDIDEPHRLIVKPQDKDPIVLEFSSADFQQGEDGSPTYLFERDFTPPKSDAGPAESPEPQPKGKGGKSTK